MSNKIVPTIELFCKHISFITQIVWHKSVLFVKCFRRKIKQYEYSGKNSSLRNSNRCLLCGMFISSEYAYKIRFRSRSVYRNCGGSGAVKLGNSYRKIQGKTYVKKRNRFLLLHNRYFVSTFIISSTYICNF